MKTIRRVLVTVLVCTGLLSWTFAGVPKAIPVSGGAETAQVLPVSGVLKGPKKLVAVSKFENKAASSTPSWRFWQQWNMDIGLSEMLTDSLVQSGKFIVLERQDLESVLDEQDLGASGRTTAAGGAKMGQLNRAQVLIKGALTEFEFSESGGNQGMRIKGFNIGMKSSNAHIALIIYLIDTTTGQVIDSQRVEGKAESGGLTWNYSEANFGFGSSGFKQTPLGKAIQMAIDQAVVYVSNRTANMPWKGSIVKANGDKVYVNSGSDAGITPGMVFDVRSKGEDLIDPETGLNLGSENEYIGRIEIVTVQPKFSIAKVLSGEGIKRGDIVQY